MPVWRTEIDRHLTEQDVQFDRIRRESEERNANLLQRLRASRGSTAAPGGVR